MPDVSSRKFASVLSRALAEGGRLKPADLTALKSAQAGITNVTERAAAESLLALLRNDRELDAFEVEPARRALGVLLGVTRGPLPADLEKVLTHAVPQANVQVKHYELSFDLSGPGPTFPARAVITLDQAAPKAAVLEANAERLAISAVLADGKRVPFKVVDGRLHVECKGARALQVDYTVKPTDSSGADAYGLVKDKYTGRMWTMTWPYNTGALFPSNSAPADGSTSSVTVKVAGGMQAVGTGTATGGAFVTAAEAPAYATAFYAASDFQLGEAGSSHDGVAVSGYGSGDKVSKKSRDAYQKTAREALDFYSGWLGKYDYGSTLKLVEVTGGLGGMEHTGAVAIMMNSAKDPETSSETAAHEVAHHWFGDNLRIATWGDFWMSEGFTNYATYRFFEHRDGEPKLYALLDRAKGELSDALETNPHALAAPPNTDVQEIFDSVPYEMGPWMLRMMEAELGRPKFDGLLKAWYQAHRQKAVSTDDFVKFAKAKTGHDFAPFFKAWNSITAVPTFAAEVKMKGSKVTATLAASTPVPSGLKLPLKLFGIHESKTVLVDPSKPFTLDAGFQVTKVQWNPERTVLCNVR